MSSDVVRQAVLEVFRPDPAAAIHGWRVKTAAPVSTSRASAELIRMEREGLVESWWQENEPERAGWPRRRMYRLTAAGRALLTPQS